MVPEISHRCPACGVSLRDFGEGILFCPECGSALAGSKKNEERAEGKQSAGDANVTAPGPSAPATTAESDKPSTPTINKSLTPAEERGSARERTRETLQ